MFLAPANEKKALAHLGRSMVMKLYSKTNLQIRVGRGPFFCVYLSQNLLAGIRLCHGNEPLDKIVSLPHVLLVPIDPHEVVLHLGHLHLRCSLGRPCVEHAPDQSLDQRRSCQGVRGDGQGVRPECHYDAEQQVVSGRLEEKEVKEGVADAFEVVEEPAAQDKHPSDVLNCVHPEFKNLTLLSAKYDISARLKWNILSRLKRACRSKVNILVNTPSNPGRPCEDRTI